MTQQRTADVAVGMMDAAYFIGRKELLDFFNTLLALKLTKIEQTASGAIACQITDLIFPGSIPLSRIDWNAKSDYEYVQNYKLLQSAFNKHNVQRHVDVDKLIRAKYQDNLEFCQWLKAFFDQSGAYVRENYDPIAVRAKGKGGKQYNAIMGSTTQPSTGSKGSSISQARQPISAGSRSTTTNTTTRPTTSPSGGAKITSGTTNKQQLIINNNTTRTSTTTKTTSSPSAAVPTNPIRAATAASNRPVRDRPVVGVAKSSATAPVPADASSMKIMADAALIQKNSELATKLEHLEIAVVEIEKERDFYFEKLRNVEVLLQIHQERINSNTDTSSSNNSMDTSVMDNIFKILYATAEENVIVDDNGNAVPAGPDGLFDTSRDMTNGTMTSFMSQQQLHQQPLEPPQEDEQNDDDDDDLFVDIPQQPEDTNNHNNNNSKSHVTDFLQNDEEEDEDDNDNELLVQDE